MNNLLYFLISTISFDLYQSCIKAMQFIYNIVHKKGVCLRTTQKVHKAIYMKHILRGS